VVCLLVLATLGLALAEQYPNPYPWYLANARDGIPQSVEVNQRLATGEERTASVRNDGGIQTSSAQIQTAPIDVKPAVSVESDAGFLISLPSPPPSVMNEPEFNEDKPRGHYYNQAIARDRNRMKIILSKMHVKTQALVDHDTWLEQARRAIERVRKQMLETKNNRDTLQYDIDQLKKRRHHILTAERKIYLEAKLSDARGRMGSLERQHKSLADARGAIYRSRKHVEQQLAKVGHALRLSKPQLLAKIQEFKDSENELANMGQSPITAGHVDDLLDDEDSKN